jgi:hypothetical protein
VSNDNAFLSTYVSWLALAWDHLEQIDASVPEERAMQVEVLRLEITTMGVAVNSAFNACVLPPEQHDAIKALLTDLSAWLAFDSSTVAGITRQRLHLAQDRIFDEIVDLLDTDAAQSVAEYVAA